MKVIQEAIERLRWRNDLPNDQQVIALLIALDCIADTFHSIDNNLKMYIKEMPFHRPPNKGV